MPYLQATDVPGVPNADELIAELDVYLALRLPCLNDLGTSVTTSETAGPFQRAKSNGGGHIMWTYELDSLRLLCGQSAGGGALPRGSFPDPEPIDDLFVRRPGWPPIAQR